MGRAVGEAAHGNSPAVDLAASPCLGQRAIDGNEIEVVLSMEGTPGAAEGSRGDEHEPGNVPRLAEDVEPLLRRSTRTMEGEDEPSRLAASSGRDA